MGEITTQSQGRWWWMSVKQRVTGNGNKMGTVLRNDGEGLGEGTASCYRHWRDQLA